MSPKSAALLALFASFFIYLIPVAANVHFIMPLGILLPLEFDLLPGGLSDFALVAFAATAQLATWLFFYSTMRVGKGGITTVLLLMPFALAMSVAMSATMMGLNDGYMRPGVSRRIVEGTVPEGGAWPVACKADGALLSPFLRTMSQVDATGEAWVSRNSGDSRALLRMPGCSLADSAAGSPEVHGNSDQVAARSGVWIADAGKRIEWSLPSGRGNETVRDGCLLLSASVQPGGGLIALGVKGRRRIFGESTPDAVYVLRTSDGAEVFRRYLPDSSSPAVAFVGDRWFAYSDSRATSVFEIAN